ncbi:MAG: CIA30 family protein [Candidatus Marinimicrobia bacterium]|nr:CIA30 family protein [Candidatus Neomarinimicrobiota bacterium]|tara:strand:+ start:516 stop:1058 length:543 start_codon:yes stop_codon:yes gene_type:complete
MLRKFFIYFYCLFLLTLKLKAEVIYDFKRDRYSGNWRVINDGVMGGLSSGKLGIDDNGNGVFYGFVSLDNYGGFTSIRLRKKVQLNNYNKIVLRVFGDNKLYQLRVKSRSRDRHVYVKNFYAESKWQEIEIDLKSMKPQFRGRKLNKKNFNNGSIEEIGILVGNKVEEEFRLKIDYLILK